MACQFLVSQSRGRGSLLFPSGLVASLWLPDQSRVTGGGCSSVFPPRALTTSTYKTRSKNADLYYQAVERETVKMGIIARGEEGCLPTQREQSRASTLHYQATPVNICKCPFKARKPGTGSLDDLLRGRRNRIDLVVRGSHKKKECVRAGDQRGGKWLKV